MSDDRWMEILPSEADVPELTYEDIGRLVGRSFGVAGAGEESGRTWTFTPKEHGPSDRDN